MGSCLMGFDAGLPPAPDGGDDASTDAGGDAGSDAATDDAGAMDAGDAGDGGP